MKVNALVMGDIGVGKTRSLLTLLRSYIDPHTGMEHRGAGLDTFVIAMEPGYEAAFGVNGCDNGLHVHYHPPLTVGWDVLGKYAKLANTMPIDSLLKMADPGKSQYTQFGALFGVCQSFTCDNCGEDFGDVSEFGDDRAIAIDTLTSLTSIALQAVVGGKPIKSLPEYGATMEFIEAFLKLWWGNTHCTAVLTAHIDKEVSPITGLASLTAHTIGQKLAPKIVKIPDEVIIAKHENGRYLWSTIEDGVILKRRRLPESAALAPDFSQLFRDA